MRFFPFPLRHGQRLKRIALFSGGFLCLLVLLAAGGIAALPAIISLPSVQKQLRATLTSKMHRQIGWDRLSLSWRDGLSLSGFVLGSGPAPVRQASVASVKLVPAVGRDDSGRFVSLRLDVADVRADLAPGPPSPPKKPAADPLTSLAEAVRKLHEMKVKLPVDLRARVAVAPVNLTYHGAGGKELTVDGLSFLVDLPSLATQPLRADVAANLRVDGKPLRQLRLAARVSDLVTPERFIRPARALLDVTANFPGGTVTAKGGVSAPDGFAVGGRCALPELLAAARPLLSPRIPELAGTATLDLRAKIDQSGDLRIAMAGEGSKISARGGAVRRGAIGPQDLRLRQEIRSDHRTQRVEFPGGSIAVPGVATAAWSATVDRPTSKERTVRAHLGPLRVDLDGALALARPLLAKPLPVSISGGELALDTVDLHLEGPGNRGEARIGATTLRLARLRSNRKGGSVTATDLGMTLEKLTAPLAAALPTRLDAAASWEAGGIELLGNSPATLRGMRGSLTLSAGDLELKSPSPRRFAGSVEIGQSLELREIVAAGKGEIRNLRENLRLLARADRSGDIEASLPEARLSAAELRPTTGKKVAPFPLSATLDAAGIRIPAAGGFSLGKARWQATAGDFLKSSGTAGLTPDRRVATTGEARLDLRPLLAAVAPFVPAGISASGVTTAGWNLETPLPKGGLPAEKNPLRKARAALALLERGEASLRLESVAVRRATPAATLVLEGVTTESPLRITTARSGATIGMGGTVRFSRLSGLPGGAAKLPPQHGRLTLEGDLADWSRLRLRPELTLAPLGVDGVAELTVDRVERLLDETGKITPATALKRLDGTLFANLDASPGPGVPLPAGMALSGDLTAGARLDLTAGRDLRLRGYLQSRDFSAALANGARIDGLRSDLAIDRTYRLAAAGGESWVPLSSGLLRPSPDTTPAAGAAELARRIRDDLRGEVTGPRKITARSVAARVAGIPLKINSLEGDLDFRPEATGFTFIQGEMLGGTARARGVVDLRPQIPVLAASCSFSNLDADLLLPPERRGRSAGGTEVTGDLALTVPLTTGERDLLEGMTLKMNLYRIGSATLERALYSLDPLERNEQVVAQRKLLRRGGLKWGRVAVVDGSLGLEGEAQVAGVTVAIPRVDRMRLADLPLRRRLATVTAAIGRLSPLLELARADMIAIGKNGSISLKRSTDGN